MFKKNPPFSLHAVAGFVLLCGAFAAILGGIAGELSSTAIPTDGGSGLDAGKEPLPYTVIIDAGHGGEDGGTQSAAGLEEKTVNLEIARMLDTMLRTAGIPTVMTRTEDILLYDRNANYKGHKKMLDLAARRQIAEKTEGAIFISIHMNAFPEEKYRGLQVFYSPHDTQSQALAQTVQAETKRLLQPDNQRKIKKATSSIYLLDRLHCPAILIECGFLSNSKEAALLETEEYRKQLAFVLFCAVMSHISEYNA